MGEPVARPRVGCLGADPGCGPHRRDHRHLVLHAVEDHDQRRPHENAVGEAETVRLLVRQPLDQPHRVVAHVTENAGRHGRKLGRQRDRGFSEERAERGERGQGRGRKVFGVRLRRPIDLGCRAIGPPHQIGVAADDGVAAAGRTAFDRFQQETVRPLRRELEHDRDRRFEVGDEPRPSDLRRALIVAAREAWKVRLDGVSAAFRVELRDGGFRRAHGSSSLPASLARAF